MGADNFEPSTSTAEDFYNLPLAATNNDAYVPEDLVNHPKHYQTESGLETIDVIKAFTAGMEGIEAVCTGNIIKYITRWKKKNGLQDLEKAEWYLKKLISEVKNHPDG